MRHWLRVVLAATPLVSSAVPTQAATVLYLDVPGLVEIADLVVAGEIVDEEVFVGELGHITTRWTVAVASTLDGAPAERVAFTQWAGTLGGRTEQVPGDGTFQVGDDVVLFLSGTDPTDMYLAALAQSVFRVAPGASVIGPGAPLQGIGGLLDALGVEAARLAPGFDDRCGVFRDLNRLTVMVQAPEGLRPIDASIEAMTLGDLRAAVRAAADGDR